MKNTLEIHGMAGHLIRRLNQISTSVFADRVADAGFDTTPVEFAALSAINNNAGIDQKTLAGMIAYDSVTIGGVVERLEKKGWLRRKVSAVDRRSRVLHLTSTGAQSLGRLTPIVQALQDEILSGLTDTEKEQLLSLMDKATLAGNDLSRAPLQPDANVRL